jgi:glyoxylase-like metal-dependent hydrolase (beta-lactamase superfamily II)
MPSRTPPPPAEVVPGVWSAGLPFPNPLGFTFSYFVRVADGVVAVDMGWDSEESWQAFRSGLGYAGASLDQLLGVVVTHVHPDHYGLAGQIRAHTSAWIAVHPAERPQIASSQQLRTEHVHRMAAWLTACGAPQSEFEVLRADAAEIETRISLVPPDFELEDGQAVPDTDGALVAVHTPGHTPGHLCFRDRERNLLFTGDHVLPRVTPNISRRPTSDPDPLADFIASVDRVRQFDGALVLPGHEWVFDALGRRLDALVVHHDERLDQMEAAVRGGAATVWEVAQIVGWSRPFETLEGRARRSALGETSSHLYRLSQLGRLCRTDDNPVCYSVTPGSGDGALTTTQS